MPSVVRDGQAGRFERALLLGVLALYAVALPWSVDVARPGFSTYDEESTLDQLQAWREGAPLMLRYARSSLHRLLAASLVGAGGPHLYLARLPAMLAVFAEAVLLFLWVKDKIGERAALWAVLADLLCTATFLRGGSLLGYCLLPALFLAHALLCDRLKRPWQAALWGLSAALCALDYEGWTAALLFLVPYFLWRWRASKGMLAGAAAGAVAGLALVIACTPDLLSQAQSRRTASTPDAGWFSQPFVNLKGLLGAGDRLPFSASPFHPWPAPWTWILILLGAGTALACQPWLGWLLVVGSAPLLLAATSMEPHRLSLAQLALAAFAGSGAARLWRKRWGAAACVALLAFGCGDEAAAWVRTPSYKLEAAYGGSVSLERTAQWLADHQPPQGWDVICGLGPDDDGAFRFMLAQDGVGPGAVPVAMVPWDYRPGLKGMPSVIKPVELGGYHAPILFFPFAKGTARLKGVRDVLEGLRRIQIREPSWVICEATTRWLQDPAPRDPWARTVVWELWLHSSLLARTVDLGGVKQMLGEPLVCAWAPDVVAGELKDKDPALAARFTLKAEAVDPSKKGLSVADRTARY